MDGKLLEGSDVKLSCKSSDGSDPIHYKWERVLDKGKSLGKLPNLALIGKEPVRVLSAAPLPTPWGASLSFLTHDCARPDENLQISSLHPTTPVRAN